MKQWLRIGVSLVLLAAAFWFLDVRAMSQALQRLSIAGVIAAFFATLLIFAVLGWRWFMIVQPLAPRPMHEHFKHYFLATFLNTFTPANLGGDAYRIVSLRSAEHGTSPIIIAVVRERVLGLLSYLLACPLLAVCTSLERWKWQPTFSAPFEVAVIAASAAAAALLVARMLTTRIARMRFVEQQSWLRKTVSLINEGMRFPSRRQFGALLALSLVGVALWITAVEIVATDLGIRIAWPALGLVVVIAELLRMLPTTIQGVGMREAAFAYLVGQLGSPPESGFVLGGISYLILTGALAFCGMIGWVLVYAKRGK